MDDAARAALREPFVAASMALAGVRRADLFATGMLDEHLALVCAAVGHARVAALCAPFTGPTAADATAQIAVTRALLADGALGPLARSVTKLWYAGVWCPPDGDAPARVASPRAYREGLVWSLLGANPMAAREPGFGAWSSAPPPGDDP